jgi:hypothetical protein
MSELDLDALYSVDKTKNTEGVWFSYGRAKFLLRHYSKSSIETQKIMKDISAPVRKLIDAKLLNDVQDRDLGIRVFVRAAIIDWADVVMSGVDQGEYSEAKAVAVLTKYDALFVDLVTDASDIGRFRADDTTVKN